MTLLERIEGAASIDELSRLRHDVVQSARNSFCIKGLTPEQKAYFKRRDELELEANSHSRENELKLED